MRAMVTGAAGFIGSRLSARLLDEGYEVVGVDAFTPYYDPAIKRRNVADLLDHDGFELIEANLLGEGWQQALDDVELVFHHAAQPGVRASWADGFEEYAQNNVVATQRLLEAVRERRSEGGLRRFVYASSSSVYGDAMTYPTPETALPAPYSPYGVTKLAGEHLCGVYARNWGIPTVSLRYFTVYGGGQRPDMAVHRMIDAALGGPPFPLFGDGSQQRDFTHVDDIVAANMAAVEAELAPGELLNVAGGTEASVRELLEAVCKVVGAEIPVERQGTQPGDVARTGADASRAVTLLQWAPKVSLVHGLSQHAHWVRTHAPS